MTNLRPTYDALQKLIETETEKLKLYDRLIACGLPKSKIHWYAIPDMRSGYSMGEYVILRCNGQIIDTTDQTKEYRGGCKYRAKHGKVVLDFTKKDLRHWLDWCMLIHTPRYKEAEKMNIDKFLADRVNKQLSILKNEKVY